jgi:uncharacterized protein (DUF1800 family)
MKNDTKQIMEAYGSLLKEAYSDDGVIHSDATNATVEYISVVLSGDDAGAVIGDDNSYTKPGKLLPKKIQDPDTASDIDAENFELSEENKIANIVLKAMKKFDKEVIAGMKALGYKKD